MTKTRPSEGSWAMTLLRKRKLKIYRQNQREEQMSFVLICKTSKQKADLSSSNGLSKQVHLASCDFCQFSQRERNRRGFGKLRKRFGDYSAVVYVYEMYINLPILERTLAREWHVKVATYGV